VAVIGLQKMLKLVSFLLETQADTTFHVGLCSIQEESETEGNGANGEGRHCCLCYKVHIVVEFRFHPQISA
jgi:hypothetical protein